ncbi:MAG: type III-B CRISPR module RAMP protein Cmr1 [Caldisericum exile]|uniref:Type III-B CRISPR module RAMP protein Cmr1 n=1 Tax=Caldisericum exile TaxID=693075 RepID=A0A2J6X746_9BACT|nr:MAG: type III-B CRISPR module RAMP protein Cmr1 [Caldisericum exile]
MREMKEKNEFTVKIKALTPIWTGDENGNCSTLRETGIIGSLRWWYEALIRGLGGYACDPTDENSRCKLDQKKFNEALKAGIPVQEALNQQICPVCQLFGCTGWARKFRLELEFNTSIPEVWIGTRKKKNNKYLKRNIAGLMSDRSVILKFIQLDSSDISTRKITLDEWALLNKTLKIIEDYGALGARTSQGNGVIKIIENNLPFKNGKIKKFGDRDNNALPNLRKFFFYKFQIQFKEDISNLIGKKVFWTHALEHTDFQDNWENWKKLWNDYHVLSIAFHVRDGIRPLESVKNKRHKIFGELGRGSKVFVSHGYKIDEKTVEVRIFGYDVNNIKNEIKEKLTENLKDKLFSTSENYIANIEISEEKTSEEILEGMK